MTRRIPGWMSSLSALRQHPAAPWIATGASIAIVALLALFAVDVLVLIVACALLFAFERTIGDRLIELPGVAQPLAGAREGSLC